MLLNRDCILVNLDVQLLDLKQVLLSLRVWLNDGFNFHRLRFHRLRFHRLRLDDYDRLCRFIRNDRLFPKYLDLLLQLPDLGMKQAHFPALAVLKLILNLLARLTVFLVVPVDPVLRPIIAFSFLSDYLLNLVVLLCAVLIVLFPLFVVFEFELLLALVVPLLVDLLLMLLKIIVVLLDVSDCLLEGLNISIQILDPIVETLLAEEMIISAILARDNSSPHRHARLETHSIL